MGSSNALARLYAAGVSLWLDDLHDRRARASSLKDLIATNHIVGVIANHASFQAAFQDDIRRDRQVRELAARGVTVDDIVCGLITDDVRDTTDMFSAAYSRTRGLDGRVSLGVDPRLADDTAATIEQALELFQVIQRNNILISVPATQAGLPVITAITAKGISVNATLIFSLERYSAVMDAYLTGLEQAKTQGHDLSQIRSLGIHFDFLSRC